MYLEAVALLDFSNKIINHKASADARDKGLDEIITTIDIEESSDNSGQTRRVDLLHVDLNVLALIVLETRMSYPLAKINILCRQAL